MKRIVIVGATSGIGLEVARLCIRAGWRVGAAGRRKEALEALRSEPRLKLAESAAQAIGEAQKLLGTRRKFSISGGGI